MPTFLTRPYVYKLAFLAGWRGRDLLTAVAICDAESSFNPAAVNLADPDGSIGLWQINLAAHPSYPKSRLMDPVFNSQCAYEVYRTAKNSFVPWGSFTSGAYKRYL